MNFNVDFSIIVPVYNSESYLSFCVQSLLNQNYDRNCYEIILVDDGSKDNSGSICDKMATCFPNVRAYHISNGGPLRARRFGVKKARGDYLIYVDSDDMLKENALSLLYKKIEKNPNIDCIIIGFERLKEEKKEAVTEVIAEATVDKDILISDKRQICRLLFLNADYNAIFRKVAKRSKTGLDDLTPFYEIRFGEDQIQTIELLRHCNFFLLVPDILYQYRENENSITHLRNYSKMKVSFKKEEMIVDFLRNEKIFTEHDFSDYRNFLNNWLFINLVEVATSKTGIRRKIFLYKQYNQQEFYQSFLLQDFEKFYNAEFINESENSCKNFYKYKKKALKFLYKKKYFRLLMCCLFCKIVSVLKHTELSFE